MWQVGGSRRPMIARGGGRDREEQQGAVKKTLHVVLAGVPVKSLDGSGFFLLTPRPCHLIFKCEKGTGGELLPDHPRNRRGLVKEHQLGQQDAGPARVREGGRKATQPRNSRPTLSFPFTRVNRVSLSLSLSLSQTHTLTQHWRLPRFTR